MAERIESFCDLRVYQLAFKMQQSVFGQSRKFPAEEKYSLTDQIRRSSRSVGANIAEAWQKRRYQAHFISKLTDADGELQETSHWQATAVDCGYLSVEARESFTLGYEELGRMLGAMMAKHGTIRRGLPVTC